MHGINNHLAGSTPAQNGATEWLLIAILANFVSAVMTADLIVSGLRADYFWGPLVVLELGRGLADFENNDLPGLFPLSPNRPIDDRNTPLEIFVSQCDYSPPTITTNYGTSFNQTKQNEIDKAPSERQLQKNKITLKQ